MFTLLNSNTHHFLNYSPIYSPDEWSESGDVYVGGRNILYI